MYPYELWGSHYPVYGMPHVISNHMAAFPMTRPHCISQAEFRLRNLQRSLWEQHVAWTRMAIQSIIFSLPDVDVTTARLLRNAPEMGNSLKPFYGDRAAARYSHLIKDHLAIAAELVKAAKAGNQKAAAAIERRWYANADEITNFLSRINPHIPKEAFRKMFYEHLALTKSEAVAILSKDYKKGVELYDRIEQEALEMADSLSDAIVKQFPQMF